jgi:PKD repeat protein
MKKLILLLLALCYFIPGLSFAAVSSQDIHIEWSYDYQPVDGKILSGYHLYKEGVMVCTTDTPEDKAMDCIVDSEPGTFSFTLTAYHSDGTESPHSPPYSFYLGTEEVLPPVNEGSHSFTFTWETNEHIDIIAGFRTYINDTLLCEANDPLATEITCNADILSEIMDFTITTLYTDNTESAPSNLLRFDPTQYPQLFNTKLLSFSWDYPAEPDLAGFKVYQNNIQICETTNPADRQISCTAEITSPTVTFAIAAVDINGVETTLSNILTYTTDTIVPTPEPTVLQAIITTNGTEGTAPFTVSFDGASSTGDISAFSWSFGDGATSDINNIDHQYTISGIYTAHLTVSDLSGTTSSATIPITVTEGTPVLEPPNAVISSSAAVGDAPLNVSFNGEGSTAPNSTISLYHWDFGDGSTATGINTSHLFITPGIFSTTLTVTNSDGLTNSASTPVMVTIPPPVENQPPQAIFSATPTSGSTPLTVVFNASASSDSDGSINNYTWQFGDGSSGSGATTTHTYTNVATFTATLLVTDNDGAQSSANTTIAVESEQATPDFNIELGEISIDNNWVRVDFTTSFQNPIVIAGPPSSSDAEPCVVRLQNINPSGFEIRLQEWDYQDGTHQTETVSFLVMEAGHYTLDDGSNVEAGSFSGTVTFATTSFHSSFPVAPVLLTSVATFNEADAIGGRLQKVTTSGFEYYFKEQEANINTHVNETVHYIAWEPGKGTLGSMLYESNTTSDSVTHDWQNIPFETTFLDLPLLFADIQTHDESDSSSVRVDQLQKASVQIKIAEEQSKDDEVAHTTEILSYLAFGSAADTEQNVPSPPNNLQRLFTFNWTYDNSTVGITGFRFYQNNELICESYNDSDRSISCVAPLLDAEMQFTMTALSNNVETEYSILLQISPELFRQTATFTWTFDQQQESVITGFIVYADSEILCETDDPAVRTLSCETFALAQGTAFTVKAIYLDATTTNPSNIITY